MSEFVEEKETNSEPVEENKEWRASLTQPSEDDLRRAKDAGLARKSIKRSRTTKEEKEDVGEWLADTAQTTINVVNQRQYVFLDDERENGKPLPYNKEISDAGISNRIKDGVVYAPHGCLIEVELLCVKNKKFKHRLELDAIPTAPSIFTDKDKFKELTARKNTIVHE